MLGIAAVIAIGANKPAEASHKTWHVIGAGALGFALGAGIANANRGYYRGTTYPAAGAYAPPVYQPTCYWERRQFYDAYRGVYWKRVQVCS